MGLTFEEFVPIVKGMKAIYADPKFIADADAMKVWYSMLCDLSREQLSRAVQAYIQTEVYAPTVAGIRAKVQNLEPMGRNALEAWGIVRNALTRSGYYYQDEFAKLPPEIQKAVGRAENLRDWSQLDMSETDTVIQSQFIRTYNAVAKRMEEAERMAPGIQQKDVLGITVQQPERIVDKAEPGWKETNWTPELKERLQKTYRALGAG